MSRTNLTKNRYSKIIFEFLGAMYAESFVKYSDYNITSRAIIDA